MKTWVILRLVVMSLSLAGVLYLIHELKAGLLEKQMAAPASAVRLLLGP